MRSRKNQYNNDQVYISRNQRLLGGSLALPPTLGHRVLVVVNALYASYQRVSLIVCAKYAVCDLDPALGFEEVEQEPLGSGKSV